MLMIIKVYWWKLDLQQNQLTQTCKHFQEIIKNSFFAYIRKKSWIILECSAQILTIFARKHEKTLHLPWPDIVYHHTMDLNSNFLTEPKCSLWKQNFFQQIGKWRRKCRVNLQPNSKDCFHIFHAFTIWAMRRE